MDESTAYSYLLEAPRYSIPLHEAAKEGRHLDLGTLLLQHPEDVNRGTFDMVRPLHEACMKGHYDCAALLLKNGADVNLPNLDGATALCDACFNGDLEVVKLLLDNGAEVNPPLLMSTPVHEAVLSGHSEVLSLLLEHGASLNKSDCHVGTPLHLAATNGETDCAEILLRHGADPTISKIHLTPLHEAARHENLPLVVLLLEHGANVYASMGRGETAKHLAQSSTSACKQFLQEWESNPRSLKQICRQTIRRSLAGPTSSLKHLSSLGLPIPLVQFLAFRT